MTRSVVDFPDLTMQTVSNIPDAGATTDVGSIYGKLLASGGGLNKALTASRSRFTPVFWNVGALLAGLGLSPSGDPTGFFSLPTVYYGKANTLFRLPKVLLWAPIASGSANWSSSTAWDVSSIVSSLSSSLLAAGVIELQQIAPALRSWTYPNVGPPLRTHQQWGSGFLTNGFPCSGCNYSEVNDGLLFPRYGNPVVDSNSWIGGDLLMLSPAIKGVYMTGHDPTTWSVNTSVMNADVTQLQNNFSKFRKFQHSVWYVAGDGQTGAAATAADSRWTTLASSTGAYGMDFRNFNNGTGFTADVTGVIKTFFGIP